MPFVRRDITTENLSEDYQRSVSESELKDRAYTPFELDNYQRESIEEIKKFLKEGKYKDKTAIKESLEYIENIANRISIAIQNEGREGKTTWELESDLNMIKKLFNELNKILITIEDKEMERPKKRK
jgi:hypothetical protein